MLAFKNHGTTDKDLGAKAIARELEALTGATVETGLFEGEKQPESELSLATIGAVQEFGSVSRKVPERPWLRRAVMERGEQWNGDIRRALERLLDARGRGGVLSSLVYLGELFASDVRKTIDAVMSPPKSPATLAHEGARFTHPLIWFGTMRASVRSRIAMRGAQRMTPKASQR